MAKKLDMNSRPVKYYKNKAKGMSKTKAKELAGYSKNTKTDVIEGSDVYRAVEKRFYRDEVLEQISLKEIAEEHAKNIRQDENLGAKNKAIEMAYSKIEPENEDKGKKERVYVVMQ